MPIAYFNLLQFGFLLPAIVASVIDIRLHRIPDAIIVPASWLWLIALSLIAHRSSLNPRVCYLIQSSIILSLLILFFYLVLHAFFNLGFGDVKLGFYLSLITSAASLSAWAVGILIGWLIGGIAACKRLLGKSKFNYPQHSHESLLQRIEEELPWGPFLTFGAATALLLS